MSKEKILMLNVDASNKRVLLKEKYDIPMSKADLKKLVRTKAVLKQREENKKFNESNAEIIDLFFG